MDRANVANEYTYDTNGNLTKDLNKNITLITYNELNLPKVITYANGNTITYVYDGSGSKLSVVYYINSDGITTKMDYVGNKVYRNGVIGMILTEEGYATLSGTTPTYYYYLKDHQGNNRVVINQGGTIQQLNHYYAFGGLFGEGVQTSNQPYKYNGKELDRFQGLDMYDYGARHYDAALGRWFTVDPLAEKYYPFKIQFFFH
ncbi:RHS repeat-associated core domain-containing protein [uncultured Proteiniphilum sp.]|uniref:RHS repeat domain-containing protein n=1 Tax=uncultured Proteiniphilum sp. TaxID=497637 RepID=UPI0026105A15|nr:RHS repeat-associated core domain-containing protein [uncultured Proteiniphilum sp.]